MALIVRPEKEFDWHLSQSWAQGRLRDGDYLLITDVQEQSAVGYLIHEQTYDCEVNGLVGEFSCRALSECITIYFSEQAPIPSWEEVALISDEEARAMLSGWVKVAQLNCPGPEASSSL